MRFSLSLQLKRSVTDIFEFGVSLFNSLSNIMNHTLSIGKVFSMN